MASQQLAPSAVWVHRWRVESHTDSEKFYTVSQKADGSWGCDCPKWKFAKAPKPDCKHVEEVKFNEPVDMAKTSKRASAAFVQAARERRVVVIDEPVFLQQTYRSIKLRD